MRTVVSVIAVMVVLTAFAYAVTTDSYLHKDRLSEDEALYVATCSVFQRAEQCLQNVERLRDLDVAPNLGTLTPAVEDN